MTYLNQCWKKENATSPLCTTRPKQQLEDEGANSHRKLQLLPEPKTRDRGASLRLEACWKEGLQRHSKAAPPSAPPGHGNSPHPWVTAAQPIKRREKKEWALTDVGRDAQLAATEGRQ